MDFSGKKVLVTGGSRGIGRAVSAAFARAGAVLAVNYKTNLNAAQETVNSLPGGPHVAVQADLMEPLSVQQMIDTAVEALGGLDIVINNAGVFYGHRLDEVDYVEWQEAWTQTIGLNLTAAANVCYCAARYMIKKGSGRIVNISSRGAFRGEPDAPAYGASKAGLNAMSQSLAQRLAPFNIFVGIVAPGFVETDMAAEILSGPLGDSVRNQSPLGRVARPGEVAHAVLFLASEGTEFMTGTIIDVNGASYLRS
jgi:3-oxoacyl-[acyl-carrier protein] reductase